MKLKLLAIGVIIMMSGVLLASANTNDNSLIKNSISTDIKEIKVAIYSDEQPDQEAYYLPIFKDYSWTVDSTTYRIIPTVISTKNILRGELNTENYDTLVYTFNQSDQYLFRTGFSNLPKNKLLVKNILDFVENGGGYYGSCGAAAIAGGMTNEPDSFLERVMKESQLEISEVEFVYDTAIPILNEMKGDEPDTVDSQAYLLYSGWYFPNPHDMNFSGLSLDINISKDNPIFDDFIGNERKIHWIGMSPFEVPDQPSREINVLARFPDEEISDNISSQIHYWSFKGGILGLLKAQLLSKGKIFWCKNLGVLMRAWVYAKDWEKTDKIVETHTSNKAFMTAEIYPNENKARIVRCSGHPDLVVWWGGHLQDVPDTDNNSIFNGFYRLEDAIPMNETVEDEVTYNYCIIRRIIAWEAKVPDNDLPPVYGPSEVSDINPYIEQSNFTIVGNSEDENGRNMQLDLYYQYSNNNISDWSQWTLYSTDTDGSNGWSWEFIAPNGAGYYQFYSTRHVEYDGYSEIETVPPGPDAMAEVIE